MRITVEIGDADRAKLLELAERRGEKGFSRIVSEAIVLYLRQVPDNDEKRKKAAKTKGTLSKVLAEDLRAEIAKARNHWQ